MVPMAPSRIRMRCLRSSGRRARRWLRAEGGLVTSESPAWLRSWRASVTKSRPECSPSRGRAMPAGSRCGEAGAQLVDHGLRDGRYAGAFRGGADGVDAADVQVAFAAVGRGQDHQFFLVGVAQRFQKIAHGAARPPGAATVYEGNGRE